MEGMEEKVTRSVTINQGTRECGWWRDCGECSACCVRRWRGATAAWKAKAPTMAIVMATMLTVSWNWRNLEIES